MTRTKNIPTPTKTKARTVFEYVLLTVCLLLLAIRTTYTEGPNPQSTGQTINLGDNLYSLTLSLIILLSFTLWLVCGVFSRNFSYRPKITELAFVLFILAAIISTTVASNKRNAITDSVVVLSPVVMALLLIRILDSTTKIRLVLVFIAALAIVTAFQCTYQTVVENEAWIYRYQNDPNSILGPLGVEPGTLNHMMLEHRILSKDVKGFFTTSNSAGSFTLLALFGAAALFLTELKKLKSNPENIPALITTALAALAVLAGLILTKSKGAILATIIASAMFAIWLALGKKLFAHRFKLLILSIILVIIITSATITYGIKNDRLPGGNSMLVRWQYWKTAAKIYKERPITGIGPGNFVFLYPKHKDPAALETISAPHNFALAFLTQYGPLGLAAFALLILTALLPPAFKPPLDTHETKESNNVSNKTAIAISAAIALGLLIIRPLIMPIGADGDTSLATFEIFTSYITPVVAFAIALWLLRPAAKTPKENNTNIYMAALFCGIIGFLIHNLIDFAIFEPGVMTTFWMVVACLIALNRIRNKQDQPKFPPPLLPKLIPAIMAIIIVAVVINHALAPVAKTTDKTSRALNNLLSAHQLLDEAAKEDPLDPAPLNLNAKLYLQHFQQTGKNQPILLERAVECLQKAIQRNNTDFKIHESLSDISNSLADISTGNNKKTWLNKALDSIQNAIERYPGLGRLHFKLAKTAEKLNDKNLALDEYKKTVEIEDNFRELFAIMYPDRQIVSRLGKKQYNTAKNKIEKLTRPN
ncbi:MAG: O-antigen ligase family protein [Planctomycetota bacterium]|jgi:O-antigen ligase